MARPLRPYLPPPLELNGRWNSFFSFFLNLFSLTLSGPRYFDTLMTRVGGGELLCRILHMHRICYHYIFYFSFAGTWYEKGLKIWPFLRKFQNQNLYFWIFSKKFYQETNLDQNFSKKAQLYIMFCCKVMFILFTPNFVSRKNYIILIWAKSEKVL